jgi:hypothetical protein
VRKGTTLARIVAHRIAAGSGPVEGADEYLVRRDSVAQAQGPSVTIVTLKDGRDRDPSPADAGWRLGRNARGHQRPLRVGSRSVSITA